MPLSDDFRYAKILKGTTPRDADNDGWIYEGTPRKRPAPPRMKVNTGKLTVRRNKRPPREPKPFLQPAAVQAMVDSRAGGSDSRLTPDEAANYRSGIFVEGASKDGDKGVRMSRKDKSGAEKSYFLTYDGGKIHGYNEQSGDNPIFDSIEDAIDAARKHLGSNPLPATAVKRIMDDFGKRKT